MAANSLQKDPPSSDSAVTEHIPTKCWGRLSVVPASNHNSTFTVKRRRGVCVWGGNYINCLIACVLGERMETAGPFFSSQYYTVTLCLCAVTRTSRTQTQVAVISALSSFMAPDQTAVRSASGNTELHSELHSRHYTHTQKHRYLHDLFL